MIVSTNSDFGEIIAHLAIHTRASYSFRKATLEGEAARNISREEGAVRRSCRGRHDGSFGIGVRSVHFREGSIQSEGGGASVDTVYVGGRLQIGTTSHTDESHNQHVDCCDDEGVEQWHKTRRAERRE